MPTTAPTAPDDSTHPAPPPGGGAGAGGSDIDADTETLAALPSVHIRRGLTLRELEELLDWLEHRPVREKRIAADGPRGFQVIWEE